MDAAGLIAALRGGAEPPPPAPAPTVINGGGTVMPKSYIPDKQALTVEGLDPEKARALMDKAAALWGAKEPQRWDGWTVRSTPDLIDADRNGRSIIRKRDGKVIGGQMDLQVPPGGKLDTSAIAHEVGHIMLGGDPEHRDPRWGSRSFWRNAEKTLGLSPGALDAYRVED